MKILLLEPYFTGSHKRWAEEYRQFSGHEVEILSLSGNHWKWRMHGGAISLANLGLTAGFNSKERKPDLILATDMLDLNVFLSLTREWSQDIPSAMYFHENQLNYPWSPADEDVKLQRDNHYAFINYSSALAANHVFFNSQYHREAFLEELPKFLKAFPDNNNMSTFAIISKKSSVLPLGLNLKKLDESKPGKFQPPRRAVVLWNHRWEYDKNPERFFSALFEIADRGIDFNLIVLGESYEKRPAIFDVAREKLADKILHFGYAESYNDYGKWLWMADLLPVTSNQDFFGASIIEAMYCNVVPFLPKRLAYPEHIPAQFHSTFFYDEDDLVNKIQRRIWDVGYLRVMNTRQYAEKYDWSNLVGMYDEEMLRISKRSL
jgi:glycosyltransferase involved in cell wall biosynthesis